MKTALVTGGAGFIGSHLVDLLLSKNVRTIVLDSLTYAGNMNNLAQASKNELFSFRKGDICDGDLVLNLLWEHKVDTIFHLAAESHVDNSINNPGSFVKTNVAGTYSMLHAARLFWEDALKPATFRFIHISTDEVFGQLTESAPPFDEDSPYAPRSPYSATKAASDHLARAWHTTYGLPVIVTNCSNNFGPRQHQEKLIPTIIRNALAGNTIPIYGNGKNIRDWLYVEDHAKGLILAATRGQPGRVYCLGGDHELQNLDIAYKICEILDRLEPQNSGQSYSTQIKFVEDRKGHDWRYAIDGKRSKTELGFMPSEDFDHNLQNTVTCFAKDK